MENEGVRRAVDRVLAEASRWDGVSTGPHRFGGTQLKFGRGEIGHVHPEGLVDVPFPRPIRDAMVAAGLARPHHTLPESGWVTFQIVAEPDADHAIGLLRRSWEIRSGQPEAENHPAAEPVASAESSVEDKVDESVDESFPASDPPSR
jgi:hypothetical protein